MKEIGTGGEIRTPINGFGDRYSTLELHPYDNTVKKPIWGCPPNRTAKVQKT